jgi:antirestriction protein
VASLADYNAGRLHGRWIEAEQEPEGIWEDITGVLVESSEPIAEEWAIHDHEGFGPLRLSEWESIDTISRLGRGIAEHGQAYAHWAACIGMDNEDGLGQFEEHYLGHWPTLTDYAEQLADDLGLEHALDQLDESIRRYVRIDYDALAADLAVDCYLSEGDGGVYVFCAR